VPVTLIGRPGDVEALAGGGLFIEGSRFTGRVAVAASAARRSTR